MPTIRLTKRNIDLIPVPIGTQVIYRDADLSGFGLRVGSRIRSYIAERQVGRRTVRVTIGRADLMTPEIARRKALGILSEMAEGRNPHDEKRAKRASAISTRDAFDDFFKHRSLASTSVANYRRTIDVYLASWAEKMIGDVSRHMVLDRHRKITERHGAVTANNVFRHFRAVYNYVGAAHGDLPPNPVTILTQARSWHTERRRRSVIPAHGMPRWWQAVHCEQPDTRDFLLVTLFTGMRRSEVAGLLWANIDLDGRILRVPSTKNGDPLELPLSAFLFNLLKTRRDSNPDEMWVFPGRGKSGHIVETKTFHRRVSAKSGITFTMHDLRRTFVTIAESLDVPHYALKRLLNHRTDSDVTGGYIVMDVERLRMPVEQVAGRILELANVFEKQREAA